jgi:hypothetical protein
VAVRNAIGSPGIHVEGQLFAVPSFKQAVGRPCIHVRKQFFRAIVQNDRQRYPVIRWQI